jgi:hypothetical protein
MAHIHRPPLAESDLARALLQDPNASKARAGLGMISMRERIHLIGGKFIITSRPGYGTRIEANIPITNTTRATVFLQSETLLRGAICPELGVYRR